MKQLKKSMTICLLVLVVLGNTLVVSATNTEDILQPYQNKLNEINEKLGTSYKLASEDELNAIDSSMSMLTEFITNMNLDEFENYIMELHNNSEFEEPVDCREIPDIMPLADESYQIYIYEGVHYFYLKSKTVTVNNVVYYNSYVAAGSGVSGSHYPYYESYNNDYSISSDSRKMEVTYYCTKYLSEFVTDAKKYTIKHTYTAGED